MVKIALAKGRLAETAIDILKASGYAFPDYSKKSRKLVFEDETKTIGLTFVKSMDVPIYVEKGAADVGIVGKDILMEIEPDVYEMLDLKMGACRICVAGFPNTKINRQQLVIGSKYPNVAKKYFSNQGIKTEILHLNGSVELAPIMGLSDVIVDIVESGKTLKENGLVVLKEMHPISARLIVNKVSLKTKGTIVESLIETLRKETSNRYEDR